MVTELNLEDSPEINEEKFVKFADYFLTFFQQFDRNKGTLDHELLHRLWASKQGAIACGGAITLSEHNMYFSLKILWLIF